MCIQGLNTDTRDPVFPIHPLNVPFPFSVVPHGPKMAAKAPGMIELKREVREQGTKGLSLHVLVYHQGGNIFPEAPSGLLLMSCGHLLTNCRQMVMRMS